MVLQVPETSGTNSGPQWPTKVFSATHPILLIPGGGCGNILFCYCICYGATSYQVVLQPSEACLNTCYESQHCTASRRHTQSHQAQHCRGALPEGTARGHRQGTPPGGTPGGHRQGGTTRGDHLGTVKLRVPATCNPI